MRGGCVCLALCACSPAPAPTAPPAACAGVPVEAAAPRRVDPPSAAALARHVDFLCSDIDDHQPSDTPDRLDFGIMEARVRALLELVRVLSKADIPLPGGTG